MFWFSKPDAATTLVRSQSHSWEEGRPNLWAVGYLPNQSAPADGFQSLLQAVTDPSFLKRTLEMISSHSFLCVSRNLTKVWKLSQRRGSKLPEVTQPLMANFTQEPGLLLPGRLLLCLHLFLHLLRGPKSNSASFLI